MYAAVDADDSHWTRVDAPHDMLITRNFSAHVDDNGRHSYIPHDKPGWYRKHFKVPPGWSRVGLERFWIRFNGVFHVTEAFLDGRALALGSNLSLFIPPTHILANK